MKKKKNLKYDPEIMAQLLAEPSVVESVEKMTAGELELFKNLLIRQGTYARYAWDQTKENIKQAIKGN